MPYLTLSWSDIVPSSCNDMNSSLLTDLFEEGCLSVETCGRIFYYGPSTMFSKMVDTFQDSLFRLLVIEDDVVVMTVSVIQTTCRLKLIMGKQQAFDCNTSLVIIWHG